MTTTTPPDIAELRAQLDDADESLTRATAEAVLDIADADLLERLAARDDLPDDVAYDLVAAVVDGPVVATLAMHTCDRGLLDRLANVADTDVLIAVAMNPATSPDTQAELAADREGPVQWNLNDDERVCWHLAGNPALADDAAVLLARKRSLQVRRTLASHSGLPAVAAEVLADHCAERVVREAMSRNPAVPDHVKAWLWAADTERRT